MNKPAIQPLGSKILVSPIKAEQKKTSSGIIIPTSISSPLSQAIVVLVSKNVIHLKVGDKVLYPNGAGVPVESGQQQYLFLNGPTETEAGDLFAVEL